MKRLVALILASALSLSLVSCSGDTEAQISPSASPDVEDTKEYYEDTFYENLETFTSVTGVELNITEDFEEDGIAYNYLMGNDATGVGALLKYESYLKNYGFEASTIDDGSGRNMFQLDGGYIITRGVDVQDNIVQYIILIPRERVIAEAANETVSTELKASPSPSPEVDVATAYAEFCSLVDNEKYSEATSYFFKNRALTLDYSDARSYFNYAKAMQLYREPKLVTFEDLQTVLELLSDAPGFKDSDEIVEKINSDLELLVGHYLYVKLDKYSLYIGFDILIEEDGFVGMECIDKKGEETNYLLSYQLVYLNLEGVSYYGICSDYDLRYEGCEYSIASFDGDSIMVIANSWYNAFGYGSSTLFIGVYDKIS